jgi:hypothetical protein
VTSAIQHPVICCPSASRAFRPITETRPAVSAAGQIARTIRGYAVANWEIILLSPKLFMRRCDGFGWPNGRPSRFDLLRF